MNFHPKPYRSDLRGRIQFAFTHHTVEIAAVVLVLALPVGIVLGAIIDSFTV